MRKVLYALSVTCVAIATSTGLYASERYALVIGNSQYQQVEFLPNPVNDARVISHKLAQLGFAVTEQHNLTREQMTVTLRQFGGQLRSDSVALFFYAGHGIQYQGKNYLIPVDADISNAYEIEFQTIDMNMVLAAINETGPALSIAMLDACRDNPFERQIRGISRTTNFRGSGLASIQGTRGTILSYATEPGNVATDGNGIHSPYTAAMLKYLATPGLSIQDMLNQVGLEVMRMTHGNQKPWFSSSPVPRFCLAGCSDANQQTSIPNRAFSAGKAPGTGIDATLVERIQSAIAAGDMTRLSKLVYLDPEQETRLKNLFSVYQKLSVIPTVGSPKQDGGNEETLVFELVEAVNRGGNRVLPTDSWKTVMLRPRSRD